MIWPLLRSFGRDYERAVTGDQSSEKRMIIDALSDIEYEHETGKINDDDYNRLREHYLRKADEAFDEEDLEEHSQPGESGSSSDLEDRINQERERLT
ncbi:MAG: hypothetical protein ABEH89_00265 [bacterium]